MGKPLETLDDSRKFDAHEMPSNDVEACWNALAAEIEARGGIVWPPQACALHDELARRAAGGDEAAMAALLEAVPRDLPPAFVRAHRDAAIRGMAAALASSVPGMSVTGAANFLATAGRHVAAGRRLGERPPFSLLRAGERAALEADIRRVLSWSGDGDRWPKKRQILNIIKG